MTGKKKQKKRVSKAKRVEPKGNASNNRLYLKDMFKNKLSNTKGVYRRQR